MFMTLLSCWSQVDVDYLYLGTRLGLMKKFIAAGTLKEFKAEQVVTWKAGEDESIDGVNYQIGLVTYKAQTIFGEKPVNAKALVKGGEVDRWVFAKSGMEMR